MKSLIRGRPEIPIFPLEPLLVYGDETVEVEEQHPIEDRALRMARAVDSQHIGNPLSIIVPIPGDTYRIPENSLHVPESGPMHAAGKSPRKIKKGGVPFLGIRPLRSNKVS